MPDRSTVAVIGAAARTTSGNGSQIAVPPGSTYIAVRASVTAVSGTTPSLGLSVEWAHGDTLYAPADPADSFTAITATGRVVKLFPVKGDVFRIVYAITGTTPSFTFSISAYGV